MAAFPFPSPFPVLEFAVVAPDFLVFLAAEVLVEVFFSALDSSFWNRSFELFPVMTFLSLLFFGFRLRIRLYNCLGFRNRVSAGSGATSSVAAARLPG
jgi:hypothetical protein